MKSHIKRLIAPKSWTLLRKEEKFVVRPKPGAHPAKLSMPVALLLKSLGYASTTKEAKKILNTREVLVDGRRVKEHKFPVGLMDVIAIKETGDNYRVLLDKKAVLKAVPVDKEEAGLKLCRIKNKTAVKKGRIQLNLDDNKNILVDKDIYKAGDSVLITVPFQEIKQHFKLEKGAMVYLIGGKHSGQKGILDSIEGRKMIYTAGRKKAESLKKYAFVVGKGKEAVKLE